MAETAPVDVGFYGKLPSHGDFLRRRVSDGFVHVWDGWLQECIAASRAALGERWLDVYLTSPAWRFASARGILGAGPVIGLMVPSVDRVGRYFHLTLVAALPDHVNIISAASAAARFFESAERLAVDTLAAETVDFDAFDECVIQLAEELAPVTAPLRVVLDPGATAVLGDAADGGWQIPIGAPSELAPVFEQLLSWRLMSLYEPLMLWWTDGSSVVEPSCLIGRGLPAPEAFAAFLDGSWDRRQWQSLRAQVDSSRSHSDTVVNDPMPPRFRSAGATDVGRLRSVNQDCFLERSDVGLWAVADGLGGHSEGDVASQMVCDALAEFVPDASFEQMIDAAGERLHRVNDYLVRASKRPHNAALIGSTVVLLLVRGTRCAVIWAGDSRVYRARRGRLEQLTRDHSLAAESQELAVGEAANAITRAIGGEPTLALDIFRDRVRTGDRFLLCSDGLTRAVPEERILEWMAHENIGAAVDGLIAATLQAGAPDNVTVVIVEAYSQTAPGAVPA